MNDKKIKLATDWIVGMDAMEAENFKYFLNRFINNPHSLRSLRRPEDWDTVRENIYKYIVFGQWEALERDARTWKVDKVLEAMNHPIRKAAAQALREHWAKKKGGHGIGD